MSIEVSEEERTKGKRRRQKEGYNLTLAVHREKKTLPFCKPESDPEVAPVSCLMCL